MILTFLLEIIDSFTIDFYYISVYFAVLNAATFCCQSVNDKSLSLNDLLKANHQIYHVHQSFGRRQWMH